MIFASFSLNGTPFNLLTSWVTPMIFFSLLKIGIQSIFLVLYPSSSNPYIRYKQQKIILSFLPIFLTKCMLKKNYLIYGINTYHYFAKHWFNLNFRNVDWGSFENNMTSYFSISWVSYLCSTEKKAHKNSSDNYVIILIGNKKSHYIF